MKISSLSVSRLFGIFDHSFSLNSEERVTILHGPNGFGKTTILKIVSYFFNSDYIKLNLISFDEFSIQFEDNSSLHIKKYTSEDLEQLKEDKSPLIISLKDENQKESYDSYRPSFLSKTRLERLPSSMIANLVPGLKRVGSDEWVHLKTSSEVLSTQDVLWQFGNFLPDSIWRGYACKEPDWLTHIKQNVYVRFIESQRLISFPSRTSVNRYDDEPIMISTVAAYSENLAQIMRNAFQEYGKKSQSLDKTYPLRVVKNSEEHSIEVESLRSKLADLDSTRSHLISLGLLDPEKDSELQIQASDIDKSDESTKRALSVYVDDVEEKLGTFEDVAQKIDLLQRLTNQKLQDSYKKVSFDKDKGFIFTAHHPRLAESAGSISPTDLSSGEQHELIILYELLFKAERNTLVMIDEPEISLHVGWQVKLLADLQEIAKISDLDILIATHSPDVIGDRWDLTVELKGE